MLIIGIPGKTLTDDDRIWLSAKQVSGVILFARNFANRDQVTNQLGGLGGGDSLFAKLLPMLAPLVMSYLGGKKSSSSDGSGGGGLTDLLGGLLGGGTR